MHHLYCLIKGGHFLPASQFLVKAQKCRKRKIQALQQQYSISAQCCEVTHKPRITCLGHFVENFTLRIRFFWVCGQWRIYSKIITSSSSDLHSQQLRTSKLFPALIVSLGSRSGSGEPPHIRPTLTDVTVWGYFVPVQNEQSLLP